MCSKINIESDAISRRLRQFMEQMGWSVSEFAEKLGVEQPVASMYLTGRRIPGTLMQAKIRALGCNTDWLITGQTRELMVRDEGNEYLKRIAELEAEVRDLKSRLDAVQKAVNPTIPPLKYPKSKKPADHSQE